MTAPILVRLPFSTQGQSLEIWAGQTGMLVEVGLLRWRRSTTAYGEGFSSREYSVSTLFQSPCPLCAIRCLSCANLG